MNDYWTRFWVAHGRKTSDDAPQVQVLRTLNCEPVSEAAFQALLEQVEREISLSSEDKLLDLCCGNGLVTTYMADRCKGAVGVDVSPDLVKRVDIGRLSNVRTVVSDVRNVRFEPESFDKVLMYAALQYLTESETVSLFREVATWVRPGGVFFLGDVPDRGRMWNFYDTPQRESMYFDSVIDGVPAIGTWFDPIWLTKLGRSAGFSLVRFIEQPKGFPFRHYRFDIALEKT